jgi:hypothetical protein
MKSIKIPTRRSGILPRIMDTSSPNDIAAGCRSYETGFRFTVTVTDAKAD